MTYCEIKKFLELVYFISGPVVAIGTIIALKQYLKFAQDINVKYDREIGRQAIDDISNFNRVVIPKYMNYVNELTIAGMMTFTFDGDITDLNNKDLLASAKSFSENTSEKARQEAKELIMEVNRLCLSFQLGISDERKTYEIIGERFAEIFSNVSFMAIIIHNSEGANLTAALNTFKKWKNWIDLEKQKLELSVTKQKVIDLETISKAPRKPIGM